MTKQIPVPYKLILVSNSWTGNFERELIGYAMGCLDEVQMDIDFASEERAAFWKDVYGEDSPREYFVDDDYNLMSDFLLETYQVVDDWSQNTFYNVSMGSGASSLKCNNADSCIIIQLAKPLDEHWESIIIPRIKAFFDKKIYSHMDKEAKIEQLCLVDSSGNIIKDYLDKNSIPRIRKYKKLVPAFFVTIDGVEFPFNILCETLDMLTDGGKINDYDFPSIDVVEELHKLGYVDFSYGCNQAHLYSEKEDGSTMDLLQTIVDTEVNEDK